MPVNLNFGGLVAPIQDAIEEAFNQGRREGYAAALAKFVHIASELATDAERDIPKAAPPIAEGHDDTSYAETGDNPSRAPRGLLDQTLESVLRRQPGMPTVEVELAVIDSDPRISRRSVYNRLRHFERLERRFRRRDGLWFRIADLPAPWTTNSSSKGETGGVESPASLKLDSEGGPEPGPDQEVEHEKIG